MRDLSTVISGLSFAEGIRWKDGALYFSDMHADRVIRIGEDGEPEVVVTLDASPSGLGWTEDGRLLVVAMEPRKVMRVEHDGRVVEHADLSTVATHHANDMITAVDGTAYVGNFGFSVFPFGEPRSTALARVSPKGEVFSAADDLFIPNGIAMTMDGRTLIVAESGGCCLTAFTIGVDGELTDRRIWAQLGEQEYPDGICLDSDGAAWVALPHNNRFARVREGGEVIETIEVSGHALACVLGGADRRTLFMAVAPEVEPAVCRAKPLASVLSARVDVAGAGSP